MISKPSSMQQSQQAVLHHSSQLKQQIQTACDSALLQLRQQEQQLLREVDAAASQQWQLLWTGCQLPDSSASTLPSLTLTMNTPMLDSAIRHFASVHTQPPVTSPARSETRAENRGLDGSSVQHTHPAGESGSMTPSRPIALPGHGRRSNEHSEASSLTSIGGDEKFELISCPEESSIEVVSSPGFTFSESRCGCPPARPVFDIENLDLLSCTGHQQQQKQHPLVPHPLSEDRQAWLMPAASSEDSASQWKVAMDTGDDGAPPQTDNRFHSQQVATSSDDDVSRWLLRGCRANSPCTAPSDCVSPNDCARAAAQMTLNEDDWRSKWLLDSQTNMAAPIEDKPAAIMAPFKQMAKNTNWTKTEAARKIEAIGQEEMSGIFGPFNSQARTTRWLL